MINVVPADIAVITPALFIVATAGLLDVHAVGTAGVPDPVNVIELPRHTKPEPAIVGVVGILVTDIACVVVQPLLFV